VEISLTVVVGACCDCEDAQRKDTDETQIEKKDGAGIEDWTQFQRGRRTHQRNVAVAGSLFLVSGHN
jgi:hypothetical protein